MLNLKICGVDEIQIEVTHHKWQPDYVIGMLNPDKGSYGIEKYKEHNINEYLLLEFDDMSVDSPWMTWLRLPTTDHCEQILEYSSQFKDNDKVLIHCAAGMSRSTAAAIGVLIQHGMTPREAWDHVHVIRPIAWPNAKMLEHFDSILNTDNALIKIDESLKNERIDKRKASMEKLMTEKEIVNQKVQRAEMQRLFDKLKGLE